MICQWYYLSVALHLLIWLQMKASLRRGMQDGKIKIGALLARLPYSPHRPPMISTRPRSLSREISPPSTPGPARHMSFPESTWQAYRGRIRDAICSRGFRTGIAFFLFGLMNNILFVIVLSVSLICVSRHNRTGCFGFSRANGS